MMVSLDTLSLYQVKKKKKKKKTLSKLEPLRRNFLDPRMKYMVKSLRMGFFGICQYFNAADCFTNYRNSTINYHVFFK